MGTPKARKINFTHIDDPIDLDEERAKRESTGTGRNADFEPLEVSSVEVEVEAKKIKTREEARRRVRREQQREVGDLEPIILTNFLATPDEPIQYRIDGLWPSGGRVVLAAQYKVGKTTFVGNVVRSLADETPFLERFITGAAQVTLLDFEMDPGMIRRWLRDQEIENADAVDVIALRGRVSSFDILDPMIRSEWAGRLWGREVVIIDCLRPILDSLGLDENRDAGRLLGAIDELLAEAQIKEALIVHHMGHIGERSRGDSRIIDWPDATWKLMREVPEVESSPRYFSAYGRGVDQTESLLAYHSETRRLTLREGTRKQNAKRDESSLVDYMIKISEALGKSKQPLSQRNLLGSVSGKTDAKREAFHLLIAKGCISNDTPHTLLKPYVPSEDKT